MAQALVRFLANQYVERDGIEQRFSGMRFTTNDKRRLAIALWLAPTMRNDPIPDSADSLQTPG